MRPRTAIIILVIIVICEVTVFTFFYFEKQKNTELKNVDVIQEKVKITNTSEELEAKIKEALNPKSCTFKENQIINGYILKNEGNSIYINPQKENISELKINLTSRTLFLKLNIDSAGALLSQEEIYREDLKEGEGVSVVAIDDRAEDGQENLKAMIVKQIIAGD